jgi:Domain of unknown function (DUF1992)
MTERKPSGMSFESWVDKQIREAIERGEFDNLPGAGKPLPGLGEPDDELWWLKGYLRRERLPTEALLPMSLQLRKEIERLPDTVRPLPSEQRVRDVVAELNERIAQWLRAPSGPQVQVRLVNVDRVVEHWRADRSAAAGQAAATEPSELGAERVPWWRRIVRRRN